MAIYKEILEWSGSRSPWIRDALRRLFEQTELTDIDFDELALLLKKDIGFSGIEINAMPLKESDLPSDVTQRGQAIKLISIEKPQNINAIHEDAKLTFANDGLTIIYGGNASGKSGYVRILKKVCWSRDKNVIIKKNVYEGSTKPQKAIIKFCDNQDEKSFTWTTDSEIPSELNSIYVFDIDCANIYLNNENPTEYKPVGLDILEKLIVICNKIAEKLGDEINKLITEKPELDGIKYSNTELYKWYQNITEIKRTEIIERINFDDKKKLRLEYLTKLLSKANPEKENKELIQKRNRYNSLKEKLENIEKSLARKSIINFCAIQKDYFSKKDAYSIASNKIKGDDPLNGVGSETWRLLWEAARNYAITEVHPDIDNFPEGISSEICVLCQQPLNELAKKRFNRFCLFISDITSLEFEKSKKSINQLVKYISDFSIGTDDTINEVDSEVKYFKKSFEKFRSDLTILKEELINHLKNETKIKTSVCLDKLSEVVKKIITQIDNTVKDNLTLIKERQKLENEYNELLVLDELNKNKKLILKYYDEYWYKYWLYEAKAKTNTKLISQKIGEIQELNAIEEQHSEFIKHLKFLNKELSEKVVLRKTRTSYGATYQKCSFLDISDDLDSILSEGEKKIISLSNFLAECTINNSKNSIIFDDPVTSLDQNYKEDISRIISILSSDRQVIILTHDLNFVRLLIDDYKKISNNDCYLVGLKSYRGISGIVTDEIPYLAKNIQERIDTIRKNLKEINGIAPTQIEKIEEKTEIASKRMRLLLEKTVEDILANKTIQRFSKNINVKARQLASYVVVNKNDIDFLLKLYGKYSIPEHDSGDSSEYVKPKSDDIKNDLSKYEVWKSNFLDRVKQFINISGYN